MRSIDRAAAFSRGDGPSGLIEQHFKILATIIDSLHPTRAYLRMPDSMYESKVVVSHADVLRYSRHCDRRTHLRQTVRRLHAYTLAHTTKALTTTSSLKRAHIDLRWSLSRSVRS